MANGQYRDEQFSEHGHKKFIRSMQSYLNNTLGLELHDNVSLPKVFLRTATRYQGRSALFDKHENTFVGLTYGDMLTHIRQFAAACVALNIAPHSNVSLFMRNCSAWAITDFGTLFAALVNVPVYETLSEGLIEFILAETAAPLIVVDNKHKYDKIAAIRASLPALQHIVVVDPKGVALTDNVMSFADFRQLGARYLAVHPHAVEERYSTLGRDDVASIVYSSGTTGRPKGVMLTHKNFLSNICGVMASSDVSYHDRFLSILPLCHVLERTVSHFTPLLTGAAVYYAESIKTVTEDMAMVRPTICIGVPRVFEKFYAAVHETLSGSSVLKQTLFKWALQVGQEIYAVRRAQGGDRRYHHREEDFDRSWQPPLPLRTKVAGYVADRLVNRKIKAKLGGKIRFFISGGAPLNPEITTFFRNLGIFVLEGYGLTETTPIVAFSFHANFEAGSVGRLLPYVNVKFSPQGEVLVKGPNVMRGYFKNPAATAAVMDEDGWFHTGDTGCFTDHNNLRITGRIKEILVTSGGKNIPIGPIEALLNQAPLISQGVLLGERRQFVSCLIFPEFVTVRELAQKLGIGTDDIAGICRHPLVIAEYQRIVDEINRPLSNYEKIKKFRLMPYELSIAAGEITPTLKVKRSEVLAKFDDQVSEIYAH